MTVRRAPVAFGLVKVAGRSYYQTLRDKLHWGDRRTIATNPAVARSVVLFSRGSQTAAVLRTAAKPRTIGPPMTFSLSTIVVGTLLGWSRCWRRCRGWPSSFSILTS